MIVRTAVLEGSVEPEAREAFDRSMAGPVSEAIRRYPGLRRLVLRWPVEHEDGAPAIHMQFDLYFDDVEAMRAALASPIRQEVRGAIAAVMAPFKGRVYHLVTKEDAAG